LFHVHVLSVENFHQQECGDTDMQLSRAINDDRRTFDEIVTLNSTPSPKLTKSYTVY